jgi:hypothetical protein
MLKSGKLETLATLRKGPSKKQINSTTSGGSRLAISGYEDSINHLRTDSQYRSQLKKMASKYRRDVALNSCSMNIQMPTQIHRAIQRETQHE